MSDAPLPLVYPSPFVGRDYPSGRWRKCVSTSFFHPKQLRGTVPRLLPHLPPSEKLTDPDSLILARSHFRRLHKRQIRIDNGRPQRLCVLEAFHFNGATYGVRVDARRPSV